MTERGDFAVALVREAGVLARQMRELLGAVDAKDPLDFCTEADRRVEQLVRERIAARFNEPVLGEEAGGGPASRLWVVDPIDGTVNFIHGTPRWCISLAFVVENRVELGVIFAPAEQRLFVAERGAGARLNDAPIRVSRLAHGAGPVVEVGWSSRRPITAYAALIERLIGAQMEFRRYGSGALGMADVAAGLNDAYVELHINAWDVAAGLLLVQEAGGWTNDYLRGDWAMQGNPISACTPELQDKLAKITGIA